MMRALRIIKRMEEQRQRRWHVWQEGQEEWLDREEVEGNGFWWNGGAR